MIFLLTIVNCSIVLCYKENMEMFFGMILGSVLFHMLVVKGIAWIKGQRDKSDKNSELFFSISVILLLFLSGDYLFGKKTQQNVIYALDGAILILLFLLFLFFQWKSGCISIQLKQIQKKVFEKKSSFLETGKKIICFLLLEALLFVGSCFLINYISDFGVERNISQYVIGMIFLSWCINLISIVLEPLEEKVLFNGQTEKNTGSIFTVTILPGIAACIHPIYINIYMIYDLILVCLVSILFVGNSKLSEKSEIWKKIDSRIAGCGLLTVYLAIVLYILFR